MSTYGTRPTSGSWNFAVRLDVEPRCPGCCEWLQACVVEIREGWAWCPCCVRLGLHTHETILKGLCCIEDSRSVSLTHGIRFYTPRAWMGPPITAIEHYEKAGVEIPDADLESIDNVVD